MSNQNDPTIEAHTAAWNVQTWVSFVLAVSLTLGGVLFMPLAVIEKGYLMMGMLFTVGSTFTLAKTVRDNHEAYKLRNRIVRAKSDKLLKEFELDAA